KPSNPRVRLRKVPGGLVAALRFRGIWGSDTYSEKSAVLMDRLKKANLTPDGSVFSAVYNPPLTPPMLRRNEVLVKVKENAS
ncbi:MAG: hypothetical protein RL670_969, partial [Actinomycetota bacterium]